MPESSCRRSPEDFLSIQKEYVYAPLSTATRVIDRERNEIEAELDAFEAFRNRLNSILPISSPATQSISKEHTHSRPSTKKFDQLRPAYRQTVMDVPHYEQVYDEPLIEHLAHEFGEKLAKGFHQAATIPFTPQYKLALQHKVERVFERRQGLLRTLEMEVDSTKDARMTLEELFAPLQTTIIPNWRAESFTRQLDSVAATRQKTLQNRDDFAYTEKSSLCSYLYADQLWTYPVLTAVARARETVSFA